MKSPINGLSETVFQEKIKVSSIVKHYQDNYGLNVSKYFKDLDNIEVYKCNDTGYRFYYPFDVFGDSDFYIHFQQFNWYYMPWKWEHEMAIKFIKSTDKILEVGAGRGNFLKTLNKRTGANCMGLELNESAVFSSENVNIVNTTIENFSILHKGTYDIVCSFQVLEHIAMVQSFLIAKIECLKKGGKLIICVPNNKSFIKNNGVGLNTPPHHMGLWDETSLNALQQYYPIKLIDILFEPLQPYHVEGYLNSIFTQSFGKISSKIFLKLIRSFGLLKHFEKIILNRKKMPIGHSMMAIYEKI